MCFLMCIHALIIRTSVDKWQQGFLKWSEMWNGWIILILKASNKNIYYLSELFILKKIMSLVMQFWANFTTNLTFGSSFESTLYT